MTDDGVIRIPLRARDGSVRAWAIVDREDEDLAGLRWRIDTYGYAWRSYRARVVPGYLHRKILSRLVGRGLVTSEQCDHISGDRLDNRRVNLRVATHGQNIVNRKGHGSSLYLGVKRSREKWRAQICPLGSGKMGRQIDLGTFADESEAARAYDRAAREFHGEFARLNFPDGGDA